MPTEHLRLPPEPSSVSVARATLRQVLTGWDIEDLEFASSQALTELATNAVLHARTDFEVAISWDKEVLRVCVEDRSPRLPTQRNYGLDATTGRGLALVERLCRSWGVTQTDAGKQVWFEVTEGDVVVEDGDLLDMFADLDDEEGGIAATGAGGILDRACAA